MTWRLAKSPAFRYLPSARTVTEWNAMNTHSPRAPRMPFLPTVAGFVLAAWLFAPCVSAQQRPLLTQDPEPIGAGQVLLEAGFDYGKDVVFPASGLEGNLLRVPLLGVSVGLSSIAEFQLTGGPYNHLAITSRSTAPLSGMLTVPADATTTSDVEDLVVGAKIRLLSETESRPGVGFRFATRLPNAGNEIGLGLDTTDFYASLLFGKTVLSTRFVANVGLGILGDPVRGDRQNDVFTYGASLARALTTQVDVVGELNGRANMRAGSAPIGTESRGELRGGFRFTRGAGRVDAGLIVGLTSNDPSIGFTAGFTYVFNAFTVQ